MKTLPTFDAPSRLIWTATGATKIDVRLHQPEAGPVPPYEAARPSSSLVQ